MEQFYIVERSGKRSDRLASRADVDGFLEDCAIPRDSQNWQAALAGVPVEVDGGSVRFIVVEDRNARPERHAWIARSYPLQQIRIDLQGTRHSTRDSIISQLETVLERLRSGEVVGSEHDDDFGYRFTVASSTTTSVFGDEPAGRQ